MSVAEFYELYWQAFAENELGPRRHTPDIPTLKHGQQCYRRFAAWWPSGFMLVATASWSADRIGAEFFSGNRNKGHRFIKHIDQSGRGFVALRGGALARTHLTATDGKIELLWTGAGLSDRSFWPSHFHWLRVALHELAETLGPQLEQFVEASE